MALTTELPSSGYAAMPWRNGAGVTREIAIDDAPGESAAPFRWRLSMADLAGDGPFSEIADVDRILVLLHGEAVELAIDGAPPVPLGRHEAIAFPGDVPTGLTMAPGTGRDLNLMWDRTRAEGAVHVLEVGAELAVDAPVAVDGDEFALGEQDALRIDDGGAIAVVDGDVCVATIS